MKFTRIWLLTVLSALPPTVAWAQAPSNTPRSVIGKLVPGSQVMYEDIEIMRRILNQKLAVWPSVVGVNSNCTVCHVVSGNLIKDPQGKFVDMTAASDLIGSHPQDQGTDFQGEIVNYLMSGDPHRIGRDHTTLPGQIHTEGVYLKGQGAVYTLTLPRPHRPGQTWVRPRLSTKPLTDWELTRQAMRGDSPEPKDSGPAKESPETGIFAALEKSGHLGITETILKILAENGHNFSQLADDEKLAVIVTFRDLHLGTPTNPTRIDVANPLNAWGANPESQTKTTWEAQPPGGPAGSAAAGAGPGNGGSAAGGGGTAGGGTDMGPKSPSTIHDYELLGDRSLKQGKAQEAIKAFQRALNLNPPAKQSAGLYYKIAQADLLLEDYPAAKKAQEMAAEHLQTVADSAKNSPTTGKGNAAKAASTLAPKLIISVPKKLLDQVAAGKIPYAEFRKQVTIDYFDFSQPDANSPDRGSEKRG